MITNEQFFRKPHSAAQSAAALDLLNRANALVDEAVAAGAFEREVDPDTGTEISGSQGGDGDGGFRTPGSRTGAPDSAHRIKDPSKGAAVDVADSADRLDAWLDGFETANGGNSMLEKHGLYREAPGATPRWCHLTTRAPGSGKRTFIP